jgi:hydroxymethylglutaryl-CoA reductase (NADPH)
MNDDRLPKSRDNDYCKSIIDKRLDFLKKISGSELEHIGNFTVDPESTKGNVENIVGFSQVPIGVIGPLAVSGEYANGEFYVPMSTIEGAVITSYNRGARLITASGGAKTRVYRDGIQRAPVFILKDMETAKAFTEFLTRNFNILKSEAESTTAYGKLKDMQIFPLGKAVYVRLEYYTGDAMGMNMITKATMKLAAWIIGNFKVEEYYLESNMSVDKKPSYMNLICGRGKSVTAEIVVPKKNVERYLGTSPEKIFRMYRFGHVGCSMSGVIGGNLQYANALAAIFLSCGQDLGNIADSSAGADLIDITPEGDLYFSVTLPSLIVATVGGGTSLPTQKNCLEIMGCFGEGKVMKFAEIVAAAVLAGELSLCGAICHEDWVAAHEKYGRNRSAKD